MTEDRRSWEHGDGLVRVVEPDVLLLRRVKAGTMAWPDYFAAYDDRLVDKADQLRPGVLAFFPSNPALVLFRDPPEPELVRDGDSVLCACAAPQVTALFALRDQARHPCHLETLAPRLSAAGWGVVLYGVAVPDL